MFCKISDFVIETTLRFIYFRIFRFCISHVAHFGISRSPLVIDSAFYQKAIGIVTLAEFNVHNQCPLFFKLKIIKLVDCISVENCIFVNKYISHGKYLYTSI